MKKDIKPVAYIEGWYIDEDLRQKGIGRALIHTAESWVKEIGCLELASDIVEENVISQCAHVALGFSRSHYEEGCIFYKKTVSKL